MPPPSKRRRFEEDDEDDDRPRRRRQDDDEEEDDDRPRSRRRDEDDEDDRPRRGRARTKAKGSNGIAMTALVLGILSFFCGLLTGIPAVICGFLGLSKANQVGTGKGMAIAGMILGLAGTILSGVGTYIFVSQTRKAVKEGIQTFEQAKQTVHSTNNLKEVGRAAHQYHDAMNTFPGPHHRPTDGKAPPANPGDRLSWRVSLLPYTNNDFVFKQIVQDQAWNSVANRTATNTPLRVYSDPDGMVSTQTRYRVFVGGGALFDADGGAGKKGAGASSAPNAPRLSGVSDGTSNTIFTVEASDTVPWAQNKELPFDKSRPLPSLGRPAADSFLVLMCDGSVRPVKKTISQETLKILITRAGGETTPFDW